MTLFSFSLLKPVASDFSPLLTAIPRVRCSASFRVPRVEEGISRSPRSTASFRIEVILFVQRERERDITSYRTLQFIRESLFIRSSFLFFITFSLKYCDEWQKPQKHKNRKRWISERLGYVNKVFKMKKIINELTNCNVYKNSNVQLIFKKNGMEWNLLEFLKKLHNLRWTSVQVRRNSVRAVVTRLDLPLFAIKESRLNYPFFSPPLPLPPPSALPPPLLSDDACKLNSTVG